MSSGQLGKMGYLGPMVDIGTTTATSLGTSATSSASTNTKGPYTQLVASSARDTDWMLLMFDTSQTANFSASDIAVGAAAAEQVVLSNIETGASLAENTGQHIFVPYSVPAGTRLSTRLQSATGSDKNDVSIILGAGGSDFLSYHMSDTYGFTAATSVGSDVDPGVTANTKGSYTQITSATTRDHKGLMWIFDQGYNSLAITQEWLVDIAIGGAGSETVIIPNIRVITSTTGKSIAPIGGGVVPVQIPISTRLAVRSQSTNNLSTSRHLGITLYGFS